VPASCFERSDQEQFGCDFLFLMSQVRDDELGSLSRERDTTEIPHGARIGLNREVRSDTGAVPPL
jgi:hypothetical protein